MKMIFWENFLSNLTDNIILDTVDVVDLYPSIPHNEGLSTLRKWLDLRKEKEVRTSTPEFVKVAFKSNIFTFKQKSSAAIGTKFACLYGVLLITALEDKY